MDSLGIMADAEKHTGRAGFFGVLGWFVVSSLRKGLIDNCELDSHLVKPIRPIRLHSGQASLRVN